MQFIRYQDSQQKIYYGLRNADGSSTRVEGDIFDTFRDTGQPAEIHKLLCPIVPSAILCIGLNYREHAVETNAPIPKYPVVFMKSPNTLQNPGDPIELPRSLRSDKVDYEGELVMVIGKTCKNVQREKALDYVLGFTCGNDVSARDWQREHGGGQFSRGKSFDTFAPIGPMIVSPDEVTNLQELKIRTFINDELLQDGNTSDMIFDIATLIEFLTGSTTLQAGTVIFTGTPPGVGMARNPPRWLNDGDIVKVQIDQIGELINTVQSENIF